MLKIVTIDGQPPVTRMFSSPWQGRAELFDESISKVLFQNQTNGWDDEGVQGGSEKTMGTAVGHDKEIKVRAVVCKA